jgi:DNA-binding NarL/FixJ family response regulator
MSRKLTEEEELQVDEYRRQILSLQKKLHRLLPPLPKYQWSLDHIESKPYREDFYRMHEKFKLQYSSREIEVMTLLNKGMTNLEISQMMCIADKSVKFHITSIYKKLGVKSRCLAIVKIHEHF